MLFKAVHQVEVLDRLAGSSFPQVIDSRKNHATAPFVCQPEADITKIRILDRAQFGQTQTHPEFLQMAGRNTSGYIPPQARPG